MQVNLVTGEAASQQVFGLHDADDVIQAALGDGVKVVYESELPVQEKLRRVGMRRATTSS